MSGDGRAMPRVERIAKFWANRCLLHDTPRIWATAGPGGHCPNSNCRVYRDKLWVGGCPCTLEDGRFTCTFCDPGEPDCMSCDRFLGYTRNASFWVGPSEFRGERCHIIPRSLGGLDKVWNLVLLCHECHKLNPEQTSRRYYLDWLIARKRQREQSIQLVTERVKIRYPAGLPSSLDELAQLAPVLGAMVDEYMSTQPRGLDVRV